MPAPLTRTHAARACATRRSTHLGLAEVSKSDLPLRRRVRGNRTFLIPDPPAFKKTLSRTAPSLPCQASCQQRTARMPQGFPHATDVMRRPCVEDRPRSTPARPVWKLPRRTPRTPRGAPSRDVCPASDGKHARSPGMRRADGRDSRSVTMSSVPPLQRDRFTSSSHVAAATRQSSTRDEFAPRVQSRVLTSPHERTQHGHHVPR